MIDSNESFIYDEECSEDINRKRKTAFEIRRKIIKEQLDANGSTFLLGFPTETWDELQSTIKVIYDHDLINTCTPSNFALKKNAILKDNATSVGITDFKENGELHISYKYLSDTQTMEEVKSKRKVP